MATHTKLASGNWRFQVRRKGQYVSDTFRRQKDGEEWALDIERRIDRGEIVDRGSRKDPRTVADLIDLHVADMTEVGKAPLRSKSFTLEALKTALADDLEAFIAPMRTKYEELMRNPAKLDRILEAGGRYARKQATSKILFQKKRIGVS